MFCKYCGNEIPNDSAFCMHCGKPLDAVAGAMVINEPTRDIIFRRDNRLTGGATTFEVYYDDEFLTYLNVGDIFTLRGEDAGQHSFYAFAVLTGMGGTTNRQREKKRDKGRKNPTIVPEGDRNLTYWLSASMSGVNITLEN